MFKIGAFAIIMDEKQRILFCHRTDYDLWNLPGGLVEENESPWNAVIREVKEETGFDVDISKFTGVYSKPDRNEIVFSFKCNVIGGELTKSYESDDFKYFSFEEIPENSSKNQIARIKDYLDNNDKTIFKLQGGKPTLDSYK